MKKCWMILFSKIENSNNCYFISIFSQIQIVTAVSVDKNLSRLDTLNCWQNLFPSPKISEFDSFRMELDIKRECFGFFENSSPANKKLKFSNEYFALLRSRKRDCSKSKNKTDRHHCVKKVI